MGGDLTHHAGELRPSPHLPLPETIPLTHPLDLPIQNLGLTCPGHLLTTLQKTRSRIPERTTPIFTPAMGKDIPTVIATIEKTQLADADENVLYLFAHDYNARGVVELFPEGNANGWKVAGWRERMLWGFVRDFEGALGGVVRGQEGKNTDGSGNGSGEL